MPVAGQSWESKRAFGGLQARRSVADASDPWWAGWQRCPSPVRVTLLLRVKLHCLDRRSLLLASCLRLTDRNTRIGCKAAAPPWPGPAQAPSASAARGRRSAQDARPEPRSDAKCIADCTGSVQPPYTRRRRRRRRRRRLRCLHPHTHCSSCTTSHRRVCCHTSRRLGIDMVPTHPLLILYGSQTGNAQVRCCSGWTMSSLLPVLPSDAGRFPAASVVLSALHTGRGGAGCT